ncbi:MAG: M20 family peptidase, partial [Bacteroidia bacterium]|nr:M20 family peptidase [Bacteroidia bacterium]
MKKIFRWLLLLFLLLLIILVTRTFLFHSKQLSVSPSEKILISDSAVQRLVSAVQIPTVSNQDDSLNQTEYFNTFHQLIENSFPLVSANLSKENISSNSLLFRWDGTDSSFLPVVFLSHQDVVPAHEQQSKWLHPPFSAIIDSGYIHGRGTLDDKSGVFGLMEAVEYLLQKKFRPKRTIYFAFGHNEEVGGNGAKTMADWFAQKNITAEFILDEGGSIVTDVIKEVSQPVALIGIAEKGYATIQLIVDEESGHSSMPPQHTAIGLLSRAITNLENNPFASRYDGGTKGLFDFIAPEMNFFKRLIFANVWLFSPIIKNILSAKNSTNAAIRTTIAATIFNAGEKENILPHHASAVINFRILPGETVDDVLTYVKRIINDRQVHIELKGIGYTASQVSDVNSNGYNIIAKSVKEIFPSVIVAPYLVVGTTDARHYSMVSKNIFRFIPLWLSNEDLKRIHGINERIAVENYKDVIR